MGRAMTSHELANELLAGPDLPVHMSHDYGDRQHTTVAPKITETVEGRVRYSEYHRTDKMLNEDEDADQPTSRPALDAIILM